jgi:hypothetical protein
VLHQAVVEAGEQGPDCRVQLGDAEEVLTITNKRGIYDRLAASWLLSVVN